MAPHDYNAPRKTNDSQIARCRMAKGMTQKQLAEAVGVSQQQINQWETGVRKPKIDALVKLAKAMDIEWTELIDIE